MNDTIKKFFELRDEFTFKKDSHSLEILDILFVDWFKTTNRNFQEERVITIPYSSDFIQAVYILDSLGYYNYSIEHGNPYEMRITLRNQL